MFIFFDADDEAEYGFSVEVMDRAREGGRGHDRDAGERPRRAPAPAAP